MTDLDLNMLGNSLRFFGDGEFDKDKPWGVVLEAARLYLSQRKNGGWLPISEAPKDGTPFLAHNIQGDIGVASREGEFFQTHGMPTYLKLKNGLTHFMPLPIVPEKE